MRRPAGQTFRAGVGYPASNVVIGLLMVAGLLAVDLVVGQGALQAPGAGWGWPVAGILLSLVGVAIGLAWLVTGVNALRPVVLGGDQLHLPVFSLRRGFGWRSIALADVAGVELTLRSEPRNSRWQLVVIVLNGDNLTSDSLTSLPRPKRGARWTPAARCVEEIRRSLRP